MSGERIEFPQNFLWGVNESGFQFEMGGAEKDIDANTDWYVWAHDSENIRKGIVSGDLPEKGINYWDLYQSDHALAKELGLNSYRIGIEWSRIFPGSTSAVEVGIERAPDGHMAKIDVDERAIEKLDSVANQEALKHYRSIINDLRAKGFKAMVCLNHSSLPLWVHDPIVSHKTRLRRGPRGWFDESTVVEFTKFSAYVARKFGDLVDMWATFNEPMIVLIEGYLTPESGFPPAVRSLKAFKKASAHMVLAHARAYEAIKRWDTAKADGDSPSPAGVGIILDVAPMHPLNPGREIDVKAARFADHLNNHFFTQAITTGWVDENFNGIRDKGEVKEYMRDRLDWIGVNYYTRAVLKGRRLLSLLVKLFTGMPAAPEPASGYGPTCDPNSKSLDGHPASDAGLEIYPEGIAEAARLMKDYGKPMYITETGVADAEDRLRADFIREHLKVLAKAIREEKLDVRGFLYWALTDNYEWSKGFKMKFGLYAVDLNTKKRDMRKSASVLSDIIKHRTVGEK